MTRWLIKKGVGGPSPQLLGDYYFKQSPSHYLTYLPNYYLRSISHLLTQVATYRLTTHPSATHSNIPLTPTGLKRQTPTKFIYYFYGMFRLYLSQQYRCIWYYYLPLRQGVSTAHPVVIRRKIRARLPKELTYIGQIKSLDLSISYLYMPMCL